MSRGSALAGTPEYGIVAIIVIGRCRPGAVIQMGNRVRAAATMKPAAGATVIRPALRRAKGFVEGPSGMPYFPVQIGACNHDLPRIVLPDFTQPLDYLLQGLVPGNFLPLGIGV